MRLGQVVVDTKPLRESPGFRLVLVSRVIVLLSAGLLAVAVPVQVYGLTRSSVHVGLVSLALGAGLLVGFLFGGVLADGLNRRRVIVVCGVGIVASFGVLALNAAVPSAQQLMIIYLTSAAGGVVQGIGETALTAVTPSLVAPDQLVAASGLVAATSMLGAVVGPAVGGVLVAGPGLVANYALAALMVLAATGLFTRLQLPPRPADAGESLQIVRSLVEGLAFVRQDRLIRGILLIDLCATAFGVPAAIFPQLAAEHFDAGAELVGVLTTAPAVGALIGAVVSGWTGSVRRPGRALAIAIVVLGASYIGFGLSRHLVLALFFLGVTGLADTVSEILRRALLQYHTPEALQGRVNSLWLAQATSSSAFGGLSAGLGARLLGPGGAMVAAGTLCIASVGALTGRLPELRRASLGPPGPPPAPPPPSTTLPYSLPSSLRDHDVLPEQKGTP